MVTTIKNIFKKPTPYDNLMGILEKNIKEEF